MIWDKDFWNVSEQYIKMKDKAAALYKTEVENFNEFATHFLYDKFKELEKTVQGEISIALSGGTTPLPILEKLKNENIDWRRFHFFMVDERCVPVTDDSSNFGNISKVFFKDIPSKAFSMVSEDESSFVESVSFYKTEIQKHVRCYVGVPQFDLILLGMGNDGHTASLFPETKGLLEETETVIINDVPQLNTQRITLTYPVLLNASEIIVIVKGKSKEDIITQLYADQGTIYPIDKIVKQHSNLKWLIA